MYTEYYNPIRYGVLNCRPYHPSDEGCPTENVEILGHRGDMSLVYSSMGYHSGDDQDRFIGTKYKDHLKWVMSKDLSSIAVESDIIYNIERGEFE